MLGEGNILAHLVIVGYKVSYQQVGGSFHVYCYLHEETCILLLVSLIYLYCISDSSGPYAMMISGKVSQ